MSQYPGDAGLSAQEEIDYMDVPGPLQDLDLSRIGIIVMWMESNLHLLPTKTTRYEALIDDDHARVVKKESSLPAGESLKHFLKTPNTGMDRTTISVVAEIGIISSSSGSCLFQPCLVWLTQNSDRANVDNRH